MHGLPGWFWFQMLWSLWCVLFEKEKPPINIYNSEVRAYASYILPTSAQWAFALLFLFVFPRRKISTLWIGYVASGLLFVYINYYIIILMNILYYIHRKILLLPVYHYYYIIIINLYYYYIIKYIFYSVYRKKRE